MGPSRRYRGIAAESRALHQKLKLAMSFNRKGILHSCAPAAATAQDLQHLRTHTSTRPDLLGWTMKANCTPSGKQRASSST